MFKDFLPIAGAVIAVINGIIAVGVAQFPLQTAGQKYFLLTVVSVLGILAISAAIVSQLQTQSAKREETKKLRAVREQLGAFLAEGVDLLRRARHEQEPAPNEDAEGWNVRVVEYLNSFMGNAFVHRFGDSSGLPLGMTALQSEAHRRLEGGLKIRTARLQQFMSELSSAHLK